MRIVKNNIIDKSLKILLSIIVLLAILLTVFQFYINNSKHRFLDQMNEKLSASIKGTAVIKDIDVNVWRHFPNADISLQGVVITDSVYHRALLNVKSISSRVNIFKLLSKEIDIHSITLNDGIIHLFTDSVGYSNKYLLEQKKDSVKKKNTLIIDEIELHNITLVSEHKPKNKWYGVRLDYMHANISRNDSIMNIAMQEQALIKGLGFNLRKGYYLQNKTVTANWQLKFNTNSKELSFNETNVDIDKQKFVLQGSFYLLDTLHSHFKLLATIQEADYVKTGSLFPYNIQKKVGAVRLNKPLSVKALIEGPMAYKTIPQVTIQWTAVNNELVTPVAVLKNCSFTGTFTNERNAGFPRTDDNAEITLAKFSGNWGGVLLGGANIILTNFIQPVLKFNLTSACTIDALDDKFAFQSVRFLQGSALLKLQYDGPLSADASLLERLTGSLSIKNGVVKYEPRNLTFTNCNGDILFTENDLMMKNFECNLNKNHFEVQVEGNNVGRLASKDPGKATILCTVFTPSLDLNDFKTLFKSRSSSYVKKRVRKTNGFLNSAVQLDDVLDKGILNMKLSAGAINLNRFTATNLVGDILFQNNNWEIQKASLLHADGKFSISGSVQQLNNNYHIASTKILLDNMDVKKVFYAFNNFGQDAVTSDNLQGRLNTKANIKIGLDDNGNLVKNSMEGTLIFSIKKGALINHEPIQRIKKYIFKNRDLSHIEFAEIKDSIDLRKNDIYIHRMEIASSALTMYVEGIYSLKDSTDISIQIPLSNLKKRAANYIPKNEGTDAKVGASIYLRARPDRHGNIKVGLDLFKKFRKNKDVEQLLKDSVP